MKGKVVLVTGASGGLGRTIVAQLLKEGCSVISGVRSIDKASLGTHPIVLNLTDEDSLEKGVDQIIKKFGKIDIIIHNAGVACAGPVDSFTIKEARELFDVNVFGPFRLTQLALPFMRERMFGKIVFVSSVRAVDSGAFIGLYSASKSALESMAFDWAITLSKWNIEVSVFQPGPIATNIELKHGSYFKEGSPYPSLKNFSLDLQNPNEVAQALVSHLKSENPSYKLQSSEQIKGIVGKHLIDPTGNQWKREQIDWAAGCLWS